MSVPRMPTAEFVAYLRSEERRFRSLGYFESAVREQRRADIIEQTGEAPDQPSYMDRGSILPLDCWLMDGNFCVSSSDGAVSLSFTQDRAADLWFTLLAYLKVTPDELHDLAFSMEDR